MKTVLYFAVLLLLVTTAKAQTPKTDAPNLDNIEVKEPVDTAINNVDPKSIFIAVEKQPEFPGGVDRFYLFLQHNIQYPINAARNDIQGKVFVTFVVEKNGALTDTKILRGVSPDIDAEAIRVVSISPQWKPGIQNGRPVRVQYSMAITFKLPPKGSKERIQMDSLINAPDPDKTFTAVDKEPEFAGGLEKFYKFLQKNLQYPDEASRDNIRGKVLVSFVVEKDGSLTDIKIFRSLSRETDAEAVRVLKISPKWKPGMQNGRPVRVAYTMPIQFPFDN